MVPTPIFDLRVVHEVHTTVVVTSSLWTTLTIVGSAVAGGLAGALVSHHRVIRRGWPSQPIGAPQESPLDEQRIQEAARRWGTDHGWSDEKQHLLIEKLRLMRRLQRQRFRRRGWPL